MFRLVPPAGTALTLADVARIKLAWWRRLDRTDGFWEELRQKLHAKHIYPVNSGRTALTVILKALKHKAPDDKDEIIVPAYTCFSVAASIIKGGYKIRPVDINPQTLDYDFVSLEKQDFSRVAAVLVCSLFGIANDWEALWRIAEKQGVLLIDDAAQALGESYNNRPRGTIGDVGFYSFDRGKNLSVYSGGMIVTDNDEIAASIEKEIKALTSPGFWASGISIFKMGMYSLLSRPRLFWFPAMLPLGIGETIYDESFDMSRLSHAQLCGVGFLMAKLPKLRAVRIANASAIAERIGENQGGHISGYNKEACPAYIRLPVLVTGKTRRDGIIRSLRRRGIVASGMYPGTIDSIEEIQERLVIGNNTFIGARKVVDRLVTLPTHPYVTEKDIDVMVSCFKECKTH